MKSDKVYPGIDIIKILAMFFVTTLHIIGAGGILSENNPPVMKMTLCFVYGITLCCINLFALSTGFLQYGRKIKISKLINLRLQAFFWATLTVAVVFLITRDLSVIKNNIMFCVLMERMNTYWYLSAYTILFFLMPMLNLAVEKLERKHVLLSIFVLLLIVSVFPTLYPQTEYVYKGYSFIWLAILYVIGAYIKKYDIASSVSTLHCGIGFVVSVLLECVYAFLSNSRELNFLWVEYNKHYKDYNCLFLVSMSISMFLLLSKINVESDKIKKYLRRICSVSFSIYLIQCSPAIFGRYIVEKFVFVGNFGVIKAVAVTLGISTAINVVCLTLGFIQDKLFKIIKIPKLCLFIENKINICYDYIYKKFAINSADKKCDVI